MTKPIFSRGYSLQLRLFFAVIIAVALIIADSRVNAFSRVRSLLDTTISPVYYLANAPQVLLNKISDQFLSKDNLKFENKVLLQELITKESDLLLLGQLQQENARLRELLGSPLRQDESKMVAQVLSTKTDPYNDNIIIDKGSNNGVFVGQPVINDKGVVGQVAAVGKITSRVILICNQQHALPIQVLNNDIRVIAVGNGCDNELELEHLPLNPEIKVGDVLVTSGLGGRFPEGYPVATVSSITVDHQRAQTIIKARPTAELQKLRYLLLLWQGDKHAEKQPLPPQDVHQVANERLLMQTDSPDMNDHLTARLSSQHQNDQLLPPKQSSDSLVIKSPQITH